MDKYEMKIKCGSCNKNKAKGLFSNSACKKWKDSQRRHAQDPKQPVKIINCMACSSGNREELECAMCSRVLALDRFSKDQRRKNDNALCVDCSQEKQDREADFAKEVKEIVIVQELKKDEFAADSYQKFSSRLSSAQRSRLESASDRLETETNPSSEDWALGNDAVSLVGSGNSAYSSNNTRPTTGTGWDGFDGLKRTTTASSGSKVGFVKQNAVPKDPFDKAVAQYQRDLRRAQEQEEVVRDGSDDDSDDDITPY